MKEKFINFFNNVIYTFPLQLLILLLKKHHLIVLFWIAVFGFVGSFFGDHYGIPLLFLDPEYLGNVDFFSFMIIGFALGGFIMTWNVSFFILNSHRFHFLASLSRPFVKFCLNNALIPFTFIVYYCYRIVVFQSEEGLKIDQHIIREILGLISGIMLMITLTVIYFLLFNSNVHRFLGNLKDKAKQRLLNMNVSLDVLDDPIEDDRQWPVETYFSNPFEVRLVRNVKHYDPALIKTVINQNNKNGFVIIVLSLAALVGFSMLIDNPIFRVPAAASILLFFTILMALSSAFGYWFKGWRQIALIVIIIGANVVSSYDLIVYKNRLFGLNYEKENQPYSNAVLDSLSANNFVNQDVEEGLEMLKTWKRKMNRKYGLRKPKMILIGTSGGGSRSGYWSMHVLQEMEKQLNGKLMDHTVLMTGASGGMLGVAYFRELYYRNLKGEPVDYLNSYYREDLGKDLLNAVTFTLTVNDLFYPWQKYYYNGQAYKKDRGYIFERQLNENTSFLMDRTLMEYRQPEKNATIPMLVLSPTIIKDQRVLYISAQPVSYLTRPYIRGNRGYLDYLSPDGVEFMRMFENHGAEKLKFVSGLRMNASFPYILPGVYLPTEPALKIMDAGIRDNYGTNTSMRFYNVFKDWIDENTSGVIFLQLRTDPKQMDLEKEESQSIINELLNPVGNIYSNFIYEQEYYHDHFLGLIGNSAKTEIHALSMEYHPSIEEREASMTMHLTEKEKKDIQEAYQLERNQITLRKLEELLK